MLRNELKELCDLLVITENQIHFKGKAHFINNNILDTLTKIIYNNCYVRRLTPLKIKQEQVIKTTNKFFEVAFYDSLRAANKTREYFEKGWVVSRVETSGAILAIKENKTRIVDIKDCILDSSFQQKNGFIVGNKISIKKNKEFPKKGNAFYFVFSDANQERKNFVRIYWNIDFEGAPILIEKISIYFNKYSIPFQFKCLNNPHEYNRRDAAVLYIDKSYFRIAMDIFSYFYSSIKPFLKTGVPLFTYELAHGIGFAEDPGNGESFGMNRCNILSQAILNINNRNIKKSNWVEEIFKELELAGFIIDKMYLNRDSHYQYIFPEL